jgi:starch synthase (maltosyl-transferring)
MPAKTSSGAKRRKAPKLDFSAVGDGRRRVVIGAVTPTVDGGRYPVKTTVGEQIRVSADIFADGHDELAAAVQWQIADGGWQEAPLQLLGNDHWQGSFRTDRIGGGSYRIVGWVERFATWRHQLAKRVAAGQDVAVDLLIGAALVEEAAAAAEPQDSAAATVLQTLAGALRAGDHAIADHHELVALMQRWLPRRFATESAELPLTVDPELARFSAWYELFPRSAAAEPGRHGTLRDVIARLPYVAEMGFDVLYLPPIHPIGRSFRKGRNNSTTAAAGEPGSPWAIGAAEGGHKSVHPELGTIEDLRDLVIAARERGIELALDIAFQCAPDHPYVREHPQWFRARPDGTIQYAENPPKKYQDIYPFDFETDDWQALWAELHSIFVFWIDQGVRVFRVDNPHTKSLAFWQWCIAALKHDYPDVLFLSEAFTRPRLMEQLAKVGFSQSYTYFTWRTTRHELTTYLQELIASPLADYFRPNFWPNTPDILTPQFYTGLRSVFLTRAVLAATLTSSWGMYGPVYELLEHTPVSGREEYIDSEKYEIRHWDLTAPHSLRGFISRLNRIRREHPALQYNRSIQFHTVDSDFRTNEQLIAYSKVSPDGEDIIVVVVNLDPYGTQAGWIQLPTHEWQLGAQYQAHDLISDARYLWSGEFNYVELTPDQPIHLFCLRRRRRDQRGFEYYA